MENAWTKALKFIFLFVSVVFILICTNEISTRDSLLGHLESRRLGILEDLLNIKSSEEGETYATLYRDDESTTVSQSKLLEDNLSVTELMIAEVKLLISQGASTDISLKRNQIVKHFSSDPSLALTKLLRMKKETNLIKELQIRKDEAKDKITGFEIDIKSMMDRIDRRQAELKNLSKYKDYLKRDDKEKVNKSMVSEIVRKFEASGEKEEDLKSAIEEADRYLQERLADYRSELYFLEGRLEVAQSTYQRLDAEFIKENEKVNEIIQNKDYVELLEALNPTKLPSDYLLALLFIFSGMLGAIVLTVRNDDYIFESKIIMIGVSTGLIIFLGVKGGPSIFNDQTEFDFSSINVYSSALFGIVGGLFSEKIYSVLNTLTTNIQKSIEDTPSTYEEPKTPDSLKAENAHNKSS